MVNRTLSFLSLRLIPMKSLKYQQTNFYIVRDLPTMLTKKNFVNIMDENESAVTGRLDEYSKAEEYL